MSYLFDQEHSVAKTNYLSGTGLRNTNEDLVSRFRYKGKYGLNEEDEEDGRSASMEDFSFIKSSTKNKKKRRTSSLSPFLSIKKDFENQKVILVPPPSASRKNEKQLRLKIPQNEFDDKSVERTFKEEEGNEKKGDSRVIINVSGECYETFKETLERYPKTLLGDASKRSQYFCSDRNVYQFYRNRNIFDAILFFYQSQGKLLCPPNVSVEDFIEECYFFELPDEVVAERFKFEINLLEEGLKHKNQSESKNIKEKCWNVLEKPSTSTIAGLYFKLSILMTFSSVLFACFHTNKMIRLAFEKIDPNGWRTADLVFNVFFTAEFLLRFLTAPNRKLFVLSLHNWIDFLCITSYYLSLILPRDTAFDLFTFAHVLRLLKVLCLFRIGKTFKALRLSMTTVKLLKHDYTTLFFCFFMSFFSGATVIFFSEKHRDVFNAIPKCFYWAISTVTAVGDGHAIPNTTVGKIVAGSYMLSGILTFTLPTIYIMNKFSPVYQRLHELSLT